MLCKVKIQRRTVAVVLCSSFLNWMLDWWMNDRINNTQTQNNRPKNSSVICAQLLLTVFVIWYDLVCVIKMSCYMSPKIHDCSYFLLISISARYFWTFLLGGFLFCLVVLQFWEFYFVELYLLKTVWWLKRCHVWPQKLLFEMPETHSNLIEMFSGTQDSLPVENHWLPQLWAPYVHKNIFSFTDSLLEFHFEI